jgi:hypothetical protein
MADILSQENGCLKLTYVTFPVSEHFERSLSMMAERKTVDLANNHHGQSPRSSSLPSTSKSPVAPLLAEACVV